MSNREIAKNLIDTIPESRLFYVIAYLQGAAVPDEIPNAETLKAFAETDEMIKTNGGQHFTGSTEEFFSILASEM